MLLGGCVATWSLALQSEYCLVIHTADSGAYIQIYTTQIQGHIAAKVRAEQGNDWQIHTTQGGLHIASMLVVG